MLKREAENGNAIFGSHNVAEDEVDSTQYLVIMFRNVLLYALIWLVNTNCKNTHEEKHYPSVSNVINSSIVETLSLYHHSVITHTAFNASISL